MQINSVAFYHKINKDDRTYLRCSRMASTEYCSQVRSDITTAASLKNLYSRVVTNNVPPNRSLVDRIEILRGHNELSREAASKAQPTEGTEE